jgi:hypothetical protein
MVEALARAAKIPGEALRPPTMCPFRRGLRSNTTAVRHSRTQGPQFQWSFDGTFIPPLSGSAMLN